MRSLGYRSKNLRKITVKWVFYLIAVGLTDIIMTFAFMRSNTFCSLTSHSFLGPEHYVTLSGQLPVQSITLKASADRTNTL